MDEKYDIHSVRTWYDMKVPDIPAYSKTNIVLKARNSKCSKNPKGFC